MPPEERPPSGPAPEASRGYQLQKALPLLENPADFSVRLDEAMSKHTTLRLGGPADLWVMPHHAQAAQRLIAACHQAAIPLSFVGGGTNLLVRDGGIRGVVVNLKKINEVEVLDQSEGGGRFLLWCGASTGRVLQFARKRSLGGVEFLAGVPGSVGGGLIMNAGTFLGEFTQVVKRVQSLGPDGSSIERDHAACGFRYRASDLPREELALACEVELSGRDPQAIEADIEVLRRHRKEREPSGVPNNGSTFKNPPEDYAGRLIEAAGLKGLRYGGAQVSPKHANWLIVDPTTTPRCKAQDLLNLIAQVQEKVQTKTGIRLEPEVKIIGEDPKD